MSPVPHTHFFLLLVYGSLPHSWTDCSCLRCLPFTTSSQLPHISCWWLLKSKPALHPSTANAVSLLDLVHLFTRQQNTHKHPWHSPVVEKYDSNNLGFQAGTEWYIYIPEERTLEMITASSCHMTYLIWMMLARTRIKMCFVILFGFVMMKTTKVTIRW